MNSTLRLFTILVCTLMFSNSASALVVALSNDDCWDAPGIQAMRAALASAGHTVTLAGPLDEQSGSSAAGNFACFACAFIPVGASPPGGIGGSKPPGS